MKLVLKPTLEHMALVKIGISLWNQDDVSAFILKRGYRTIIDLLWYKIEERVTDTVPQLSLPQPLKEKVFGVIKPIGLQIFKWIVYYQAFDSFIECKLHGDLHSPAHLLAKICWTTQGTVDRKKTAELLVKDENLNVFTRYRLACDYFLKDDIIQLWNSLPEDAKDKDWHDEMMDFWSDNMKRRGEGHISFIEVFHSCLYHSNKIGAKYFLQKLSPQKREECLKVLPERVEDADILCFLLREMEEEEQMRVFKSNPSLVLQCFLKWPWQSFFFEVANCMWEFLSEYDYEEILGKIIRIVKDGYKDYNYQKLFGEFWQKSPSAVKDLFIDVIHRSWVLQCLFDIKDKEIVRLILKDATPTAKAKLIYCERIDMYLTRSIHKKEWDFLGFFIRECLPSETEMLKFKEEFEKRTYFKKCSAAKKHQWNQLFGFSDDSICKHGKRSVEEGESSSSKQCCSVF